MYKLNTEVDITLRDFVSNVGSDVLGGAMLIHRNGFVVSSVTKDGVDAKSLGAVFAAVKGAIDKMFSKVGIGSANLLLFRAGNYLIAMSPINNEVILVSLARHDSNLGLILIGLIMLERGLKRYFTTEDFAY